MRVSTVEHGFSPLLHLDIFRLKVQRIVALAAVILHVVYPLQPVPMTVLAFIAIGVFLFFYRAAQRDGAYDNR